MLFKEINYYILRNFPDYLHHPFGLHWLLVNLISYSPNMYGFLILIIHVHRWVQITSDKSTERYRERRDNSDDEDEDVKPIIKTERLSPCEQDASVADESNIKILAGLHLTFNLEAGSLLPLAIKLVVLKNDLRVLLATSVE